jgi:3-hydroxyisobutyrate dehydrogenase-like beta-hydroxyacid dehydrogenase
MKKIGFVGLGIMGLPMAHNLQRAGYELFVYNRTESKAKSLEDHGAELCSSPADVAAKSDAVVIMLKADKEAEEAVLGPSGLIKGARAGQIFLNSSTVLPSTSKRLAETVAKNGIDMLDCPVTGSAPQAIEGKLNFIVGGKKESFDRCIPLFDAMGKAKYHLGPSGSGSYAKLANNTMFALNLISFIEAISIVSKSGIDPELFLEIVGQGGARSIASEQKLPKILARDFSPAFSLGMMNKDLGLIETLASELNISTPVLELVKDLFDQAIDKGWGDEDACGIVRLYEALNDHTITKAVPV